MPQDPCQSRQITAAVGERIQPSPYERELHRSGSTRWETALRFHSGDAATVGWMTKRGGWAITEAGIEALDTYPTPDELYAELNRRYREIDQRRKEAQQNLSDVQQFIADTLRLVEPGPGQHTKILQNWPGTSASRCCSLPRQREVRADQLSPCAERGRQIPAEGMLYWLSTARRSAAAPGR